MNKMETKEDIKKRFQGVVGLDSPIPNTLLIFFKISIMLV